MKGSRCKVFALGLYIRATAIAMMAVRHHPLSLDHLKRKFNEVWRKERQCAFFCIASFYSVNCLSLSAETSKDRLVIVKVFQ